MKISRDYAPMRKDISREYGRPVARTIWKDARTELDELICRYPDIKKGERTHVHKFILPRVALYHASERQLGTDASIALLDNVIDRQGKQTGTMLRRLTSLPLMKGVFMRVFSSMAKNMFGESGGFRQAFHESTRNTVRFDILDCTYCRWCRDLGCPEIIHTFCKSDEYCFGNLRGITFRRTETLENGSKCDFVLTRERNERT